MGRLIKLSLVLIFFIAPLGCGKAKPAVQAQPLPQKTLYVIGDSISSGFGVGQENSFSTLLAQSLREKHPEFQLNFVNDAVVGSGSMTAVDRMKTAVEKKPNLIFLELGGNDGLTHAPPEDTFRNLRSAIHIAHQNGVEVLFAGMVLPYPIDRYQREFSNSFVRVAQATKTPFIPFLLEKTFLVTGMTQDDMIHPSKAGHKAIADYVFDYVNKLLFP